jgi:CSLREA domain-containing protein
MQYKAPSLARPGATWLTLLLVAAVWLLAPARPSLGPPMRAASAAVALAPRTITVNTTADTISADGRCSLREAILAANGNRRVNECVTGGTGLDLIKFNLSSGTPSIALASPLPALTEPVQILGDTGASTRVELNGALAGAADGLTLAAGSGGSLIRALVINRFNGAGIYLQSGGNAVEGCLIGTDAAGAAAAGNAFSGVEVENAADNRIGGTSPDDRNVIAGNGEAGILISGSAATANVVEGNYIGTNAGGLSALPNALSGVIIDGAANNTVGGADANARNVISANGESGVFVHGAQAAGNRILGNYVGTDATGGRALGNAIRGVSIVGAPNNTVGGPDAGARNVIAANGGAGVGVFDPAATGNTIAGNYVGTNAAGNADLGNGDFGVVIEDAPANRVGGLSSAARNVISANHEAGVIITGAAATGNSIEGNYIGTDASGALALGNAAGVAIDTASNNTVGGPDAGARNVIAGNAGDGVVIGGGGGNRVENNFIGKNATGAALPNALNGILIVESSHNRVGGVTPGVGNVIAHNGQGGVLVAPVFAPSVGNAIQGNAIFANALPGIDLAANARDPFTDGATANDAGDGDAGTNGFQNFPVINSVTSTGAVSGSLDSLPTNTAYPVRVEFFASAACDASGRGTGEVFLGFTTVAAPGNFTAAVTPAAGKPFVSATATDANGNTSEFSACRRINAPPTVLAGAVGQPSGSMARRQIATVSDPDQSPGALAVSVAHAGGLGVTLGNVSVNAAGQVFADVGATCAATNSSFTLTVRDDLNEAATATATVAVASGLPPTLGLYAGQAVGQGTSFTVTPSARPADDGGLSAVTVSTSPAFTGQLRVSPTTGAVMVTNAGPPGNYTVTVTAADACGLTTSAAFQLAVAKVTTTLAAAGCYTVGSTVTVETQIMHFGTATEGGALTLLLPPQLAAVPDSCRTAPSVGSCDAGGLQQITWSGPVSPGATVTVSFTAQVIGPLPAGTDFVISSFVSFGDGAAASYETVQRVDCNEEPGTPLPAGLRAGDDKPGSVIFFPIYASSGDSPQAENTRVSLTNNDRERRARVRLFFVNGASGGVADSFVCLGPTQTLNFLVSDYDPGVRGYIVAVAVDEHGCPTKFNQLTGSEQVKLQSGHAASLGATAFAALADAPAPCTPGAATATLRFDGVHYNAAPRTLALSNLPAPADGNETLLVVSRLGGDLSGSGGGALGEFAGLLFDGEARAYAFNFTAAECQLRRVVSDAFPRTQPRWTSAVGRDTSGWLLFASRSNAAVVGVSINKATGAGAFGQGHNLHYLDVTTTATLTVPVLAPPACP